MQMQDYQAAAVRTAVYGERFKVIYPALGLASEAGEVAGKIKKVLRDRDGNFAQAPREALEDELGDVLWYIAVLAADLGLSLEDLAARNLDKLQSRMVGSAYVKENATRGVEGVIPFHPGAEAYLKEQGLL